MLGSQLQMPLHDGGCPSIKVRKKLWTFTTLKDNDDSEDI